MCGLWQTAEEMTVPFHDKDFPLSTHLTKKSYAAYGIWFGSYLFDSHSFSDTIACDNIENLLITDILDLSDLSDLEGNT